MRAAIVVLLLALGQGAGSRIVSAQGQEQVPTRKMRESGLAFGIAGYLAGNWLGAKAEQEIRRARGGDLRHCANDCGHVGAVILAVLGGSTGVAAGVHFANNSRGDFTNEWLASLGIGALGAGAVVLATRPWDDQPLGMWEEVLLSASYLVAIPVLQLAATIHIERKTADRASSAALRPTFAVRIPVSLW